MKVRVGEHRCEIIKSPVNEKEIDITKFEFEFDEAITDDFVKEAYFTFDGKTYKEIIVNNECDIPGEVLEKKGQVEIGVVAYLVENEEEIKRFNPSPAYFNTLQGSLKDKAENTQPITPSEMEQFEQALEDGLREVQNVDINASKSGSVATITIINRDGEEKEVQILDGVEGPQGPPGKDGINGQDGKDGIDGKDGRDGSDGADAKVNGYNTVSIEAGTNVTIDQVGSTLTINSTASGGTTDYSDLENKPSINNVTLSGNKISSDLGLQPAGNYLTSESDPIFGASASAGITSTDITNWNNKSNFSGSYNDLTDKPTIPTVPTNVSAFTNDAGYLSNLVILSYGTSTWNDFINAYNKNAVIYCRASSSSDPSSGSQGRLAFMAYVNNATNPTEVEFQYYRSVSSHTASQQGDQVFVYKLTNASGGTWTVTTREASSKIVAGTNMTSSYSNGELTLNASGGSGKQVTSIETSYESPFNFGDAIPGVYYINNNLFTPVYYQTTGFNIRTLQYVTPEKILINKSMADSTNGEVFGYLYAYYKNSSTDSLNGKFVIFNIAKNNNGEVIIDTGGSYIEKGVDVITRTTQYINGDKIFTTLPICSLTPTTNNHLVNKKYVDDLVGNINTVLATLTTPGGGN